MLLAAGSMANLKPEFVIAAFGRYSGINFEILKFIVPVFLRKTKTT